MNDIVKAAIICFSCLSVVSCATKIKGLQHDPSFNYGSIVDSNMVVVGVTSDLYPLKINDITAFSRILQRSFLEQRKMYRIADAGVVIKSLGKKKYLAMLKEFNDFGVLDKKWLSRIKSKLKDTKYAVIARIEEDVVKKKRSRKREYDKDDKKKVVGEKITSAVSRSMTVQLNIYDLETFDMVWGGAVSKVGSNSHVYNINDKADKVVAIIGQILDREEKLYPYPAIPSQKKVLRRIFYGFGENLPKLEDKR